MATESRKVENAPGQNKTFTIYVNGRERTIDQKTLTYEEIVELAFGTVDTGGNILYTVTYRRGHGNKPEGTLTEGESVKVKDKMKFDVTATNKS